MGASVDFAGNHGVCVYGKLRRHGGTVYQPIRCAVAGAAYHQPQLPTSGGSHVQTPLRRSLIQSVSLIIYCTAPILLLSLVVFIVRLVYHSFIVNLALSAVAVGFTLRGAQFYFRSLVG